MTRRIENVKHQGSGNKLGAAASMLILAVATLSVLATNAQADPYETSTYLGSLSEVRASAGVVVGNDGNIYVIGGYETNAFGYATSTVLIFNMTTKQTSGGAPMPTGVVVAPAVKVANGTIYIFGGYNYTLGTVAATQAYNPSTNSWYTGTPMPNAVWGSAAALGPDGRIYVFGGSPVAAGNSTYIYDPVTDKWSYGSDLLNPRYGGCAAVESPTSILLAGGVVSGSASTLVHRYNPVTDTWGYAVNMTLGRTYGGMVAARNGYTYFMGGAVTSTVNPGAGSIRTNMERVDLSTDTSWTSIGWDRLMDFGMTTDSLGRAFVVGGWDGTSMRAEVYMWVFAEVEDPYMIQITSPADGSVVSDVVVVSAEIVNWMGSGNPWNAFMGVDFLVDGTLVETQTTGWGGSFAWDTTALVDGSTHTLTVRGYHWDGKVVEDSVSVVVSERSIADLIFDLEQQLANAQDEIAALQAQLADVQDDIAALQTQLLDSQVNLTTLVTQMTILLTALVSLQEQVNRIEDKADNAGLYGMVSVVLVIIVLVLLALMLMMSRRKP